MRKFLLILSIFCITFFGKADAECAYEKTVVSQQPVAYYRFSDSIPKGGDQLHSLGTITITNSFYYPQNRSYLQQGAVTGNAAAGFDGSGIQFYVLEKLHRKDNFSVEFWAKSGEIHSDKSGYRAPVGSWYADTDRAYGWVFFLNPQGYWEFQLGGSSRNSPCILKGTEVSPDKWTHLVGTYHNGIVRFFIDGKLVAEDISFDDYLPNFMNFEIGGNGRGHYSWTGGLDEVVLYEEALSADEIAGHYELRGDSDRYSQRILLRKPIAYWRLDEPLPNKTAANRMNHENYQIQGTYLGAATVARADLNQKYFGEGNMALCLTSNLDYLQLDIQNGVELPAWSFSCWVRVPGSEVHKAQDCQPLLTHSVKSGTSYRDDFEFILHKGLPAYKMSLRFDGGSLEYDLPEEINFYSGNGGWNYLAAVFYPDEATFSIYRDSLESFHLESYRVPLDTEKFNFAGRFRLGAYGNCGEQGNEFAFYGYIDEFALFDRALTADEIQNQFNSARFSDSLQKELRLELFSKPDGYYLEWDDSAAILLQSKAPGSVPEVLSNVSSPMKIPHTEQNRFYYLRAK